MICSKCKKPIERKHDRIIHNSPTAKKEFRQRIYHGDCYSEIFIDWQKKQDIESLEKNLKFCQELMKERLAEVSKKRYSERATINLAEASGRVAMLKMVIKEMKV